PLLDIEPIEVHRQVDHAPQTRRVSQDTTRGEQLPRSCDARKEHRFRKTLAVKPNDPDLVRARHLAAMDAAQFAQLDKVPRYLARPPLDVRQRRPPARGLEPLATEDPSALIEAAERMEAGHSLQSDGGRLGPDLETRDRRGRRSILEGLRRGLDKRDG